METFAARLRGLGIGDAILAASLGAGCLFRLIPPMRTDFPLHDGGMFYVMIEAIRREHYALPSFIPFNGADIPFAYPPLAFFTAAALADLTGAAALDILRFLPALMACATLVAFVVLARSLLPAKASVVVAVIAFAALPSSFSYLIVGAGLAKSFGLFLALLALAQAVALYR